MDKSAPITDAEVRKLLRLLDKSHTSSQITVRPREREVCGRLNGVVRGYNGTSVKASVLRGIFTSSPWELRVDDLDLDLSKNQREIIGDFMYKKYVEPATISNDSFRERLGW